MQIGNTEAKWGVVSIGFHWLTAMAVVCLFAVGLWMERLDYTHPLYKTVPHLHKSFGVLLIAVVLFRLIWRFKQGVPHPLENHQRWEKLMAKTIHIAFYVLILLMFPTGYLITTAKGQGLEVFSLFSIPSVISGIENLEDIAGEIHEMIAFTIISLAGFHMLGAIKHHFIDKDNTLKRMLGL
ncbi:MAG: cytochrome b [Agarilytica sp.]